MYINNEPAKPDRQAKIKALSRLEFFCAIAENPPEAMSVCMSECPQPNGHLLPILPMFNLYLYADSMQFERFLNVLYINPLCAILNANTRPPGPFCAILKAL